MDDNHKCVACVKKGITIASITYKCELGNGADPLIHIPVILPITRGVLHSQVHKVYDSNDMTLHFKNRGYHF